MGLFTRKISKEEKKTVDALLKKCAQHAAKTNITVKADEFFKEYAQMEAILKELISFEKYKIFKGSTPSRDLARAVNNKQTQINALIQRGYVSARNQAEKQHDAIKQQKCFDDFFAQLQPYESQLDDFNKQVVIDLKNMNQEEA